MTKLFLSLLLFPMMTLSQGAYKTTGKVERLREALDKIVSPSKTSAEIIAEGFTWSEGPLWVEEHQMLLFSDVPADKVHKWTAAKGTEVYLQPSGYTGTIARGGEKGSNGLLLDKNRRLVLCQCGNKQMARMNAPLTSPAPDYTSLADQYEGRKFNSPNDAVYNSKGELFFTDPPYGLEGGERSQLREIPFQGVYKVAVDGKVSLVTDSLTRPNGIAFLPGETTLIVANSDPKKPYWYAFEKTPEGSYSKGLVFASAAGFKGPGLPDGLKVDSKGTVFATGPGGLWIMTKDGELLGRLLLNMPASNLSLSADEKTVYITNASQVLRFQLRD